MGIWESYFEQAHGFDIVALVESEPMVYAGRNDQ